MKKSRGAKSFVLCIDNTDCDDDKGKVYSLLPDAKAKRDGYIRVIDESGEDYLYPEAYFVLVDFPAKAREALTPAP